MVMILSMLCWSPIWFIQNYQSWLMLKYFHIIIALISWTIFFGFNFLVFLYFERLCEWIKMDLNLFEQIKIADVLHEMRLAHNLIHL